MMRAFLAGLLLLTLVFTGCTESSKSSTPRTSLLVMRYDVTRDVAIVSTRPLASDEAVTAQRYADALESYAEVMPAPTYRLAEPKATVNDGVITVDFEFAAARGSLASAQLADAQTALESWFWVPGVERANFLVKGAPLALPEMAPFAQPTPRPYRTFVIQPDTGEMAYLFTAPAPKDLADAISLLQKREISKEAAKAGFQPLLPTGAKLATDPAKIDNGVLTVDVPASVAADDARLAGIVLMLAQFPHVTAVRFTVDGKATERAFLRGNLKASVTPYQLVLPESVGVIAGKDTAEAVQGAVQADAGRVPLEFGPVRTWRTWSAVTAGPRQSNERQTYLVQRTPEGQYAIKLKGADLTAAQVRDAVPAEALIALRLPGWGEAAIADGQ